MPIALPEENVIKTEERRGGQTTSKAFVKVLQGRA